jgi:hypothetical protein
MSASGSSPDQRTAVSLTQSHRLIASKEVTFSFRTTAHSIGEGAVKEMSSFFSHYIDVLEEDIYWRAVLGHPRYGTYKECEAYQRQRKESGPSHPRSIQFTQRGPGDIHCLYLAYESSATNVTNSIDIQSPIAADRVAALIRVLPPNELKQLTLTNGAYVGGINLSKKDEQVITLDISNNAIEAPRDEELDTFLGNLPNLQHLCLNQIKTDNSQTQSALVKTALKQQKLSHLELKDCHLGDTQLVQLASGVRELKELRSLKLTGNQFNAASMMILADAIRGTAVTEVDIDNPPVELADVLAANTRRLAALSRLAQQPLAPAVAAEHGAAAPVSTAGPAISGPAIYSAAASAAPVNYADSKHSSSNTHPGTVASAAVAADSRHPLNDTNSRATASATVANPRTTPLDPFKEELLSTLKAYRVERANKPTTYKRFFKSFQYTKNQKMDAAQFLIDLLENRATSGTLQQHEGALRNGSLGDRIREIARKNKKEIGTVRQLLKIAYEATSPQLQLPSHNC